MHANKHHKRADEQTIVKTNKSAQTQHYNTWRSKHTQITEGTRVCKQTHTNTRYRSTHANAQAKNRARKRTHKRTKNNMTNPQINRRKSKLTCNPTYARQVHKQTQSQNSHTQTRKHTSTQTKKQSDKLTNKQTIIKTTKNTCKKTMFDDYI